MDRYLLPCPSCHRHFWSEARACPFCAAAVDAGALPAPPPSGGERMSRAALAAFASAVLAAGCSEVQAQPRDAGTRAPPMMVTAYGVPPPPAVDAGAPPSRPTPPGAPRRRPRRPRPPTRIPADAGMAVPAYGVPPPRITPPAPPATPTPPVAPPVVRPSPPDHGAPAPLYGVPPRP
ncbi:MAG: hypothetical protein HY909_00125 [Deltaproteobacteria bacterium]|nr:hypothetical protein [Deltaproteobacteria bacterium]